MKKFFKLASNYVFLLTFGLVVSYSICFIFSPETLYILTDEDQLIEYLGFISFLTASILYFRAYLNKKTWFLFFLSLITIVAAGEEISWGQRLIRFESPDFFAEANVQNEFNLHNLIWFNTENFDGSVKNGIQRFLEVNFLFKIFCLLYCTVLPILSNLSPKLSGFFLKKGIPIPPIIFAAFFPLNWIIMKIIFKYGDINYIQPNSIYEIMEFNCAFLLLIIGFYFFNTSKIHLSKL